MDFQPSWAENALELMAKDMRTQPASRNSITTSQNLELCIFFNILFVFLDIWIFGYLDSGKK